MQAERPAGAARRGGERSAFWLALGAAALAALFPGRTVWRPGGAMDADEAVHAIEALRLQDSLARGAWLELLREAWTPERWAPPVNPHVRWYPPVHALATVPFFSALGPSDFSARLPS